MGVFLWARYPFTIPGPSSLISHALSPHTHIITRPLPEGGASRRGPRPGHKPSPLDQPGGVQIRGPLTSPLTPQALSSSHAGALSPDITLPFPLHRTPSSLTLDIITRTPSCRGPPDITRTLPLNRRPSPPVTQGPFLPTLPLHCTPSPRDQPGGVQLWGARTDELRHR